MLNAYFTLINLLYYSFWREYEKLETPIVIGPIITIGDFDEGYEKYELPISKVNKEDDDDDIVSVS